MQRAIHHLITFAAVLGFAVLAASLPVLVHAAEAEAHPLGAHPAVLVQRQAPGIDPNRFIPAHPARLSLVATPSPTYDHPAVIVARRAHEPSQMDIYLAQPPVAAGWLRHPSPVIAAGESALPH